ncbi:unnamed protein product [Gadus morhua 'NCC']
MQAANASEASLGTGQMLEGDRVGVRSLSTVSGRLQINSRHRGFLHAIFFQSASSRRGEEKERPVGGEDSCGGGAIFPSFAFNHWGRRVGGARRAEVHHKREETGREGERSGRNLLKYSTPRRASGVR